MELFHRDNVVDYLSKQKPSDEQKKAMGEILDRNQEELVESDFNLDQSDRYEDLLYQLDSVDLDDVDISKLLTPIELEEFRRFIKTGAQEHVHIWIPWWQNAISAFKIEDLDKSPPSEDSTDPAPIPTILEDIPPLDALTKVQPSPLVMYNLLDVIYSYCYAMKLYNGDWQADVFGVIDCILGISSVLNEGKVHDTSSSALKSCIYKSHQGSIKVSIEFSKAILKDVQEVLEKGTHFCLALLTDMMNIFAYASSIKKNHKDKNKRGKKLLSQITRKILYYVSWANEMENTNILKMAALETNMESRFQEAATHIGKK